MSDKISSGIGYLDHLLGFFKTGDNVVWEVEAGTYVEIFLQRFVEHTLKNGYKLVYVSFNASPSTLTKRLIAFPNLENLTVLDCFTSGKGNNDPLFTQFYEKDKEGFKGSNWGIVDQEIYIFDQNKSTLLQVQADDKSYQIIAGGDKLASGKLVAATDNRAYILSKDKIIAIDVVKTVMTGETKADDWGEIGDIKGFSGNVYLLDKNKGQVWKYSASSNGLSSKTSYLKGKGTDLSSAVSLAIDGSVWVIFNDGTIKKFTRGESDNFVISGLDKPVDAEAKLFTNENLNNLYILDKKNLRIVVIAKDTGEYQAQYSWPGVAGVFDLAAFEDKNKILLLTGERIYQIDLKK